MTCNVCNPPNNLRDPRLERMKWHELIDILVIAISLASLSRSVSKRRPGERNVMARYSKLALVGMRSIEAQGCLISLIYKQTN